MINSAIKQKVSVLIPTRNGVSRGFLSECINSVFDQTTPPDEIILIDDGSSDQTSDFVKTNFPTVNVHRQEARGLSAARNTGLKICSGEFVAFIDDDDRWMPDKLEKQVAYLQSIENKSKVAVGCDAHIIDVNGNYIDSAECFVESIRWPFILAVHPIWHGGSCIMLRRNALEKIGLFEESISFAEDYDYWIRIAKSFEVGWIKEFLIGRRKHSNQMSYDRRVVVRNLTQVFNSHLATVEEAAQSRYFAFFISFQALYALRCREFVFALRLLPKAVFANPIVWILHLLRPLGRSNALGRLNQRMIVWYLSPHSC